VDDGVRVVRQMIRHRSEIDHILQRIAQFDPHAPALPR
jgi:hypothetical protein